ncbi:MAG: hypothetical protein JXK94_14600 [Deltaproteobacteria bacterium]|nr:hypothetical protein [Deltaproteobacteria bacterium]
MKDVFNLANLAKVINEKPLPEYKTISRQQLIEKLNSLNSNDDKILVTFRHSQNPQTMSIKASPELCSDEILRLKWDPILDMALQFKNYHFDHFLLDDGLKLFLVQAEVKSWDNGGLVLGLPEVCQHIQTRQGRRHRCSGVRVRFFQESAQFEGALEDFSPNYCRASFEISAAHKSFWVDPGTPGYLILTRDNETLFSGECMLARQGYGDQIRDFVFRLLSQTLSRSQKKDFSGAYQELKPAPEMIFNHPLTGEEMTLGITTISTSGFVVEEEEKETVLIPGLILPAVTMTISGGETFRCRAQVVSRNVINGEESNFVRHEVALLDMESADHVKLENMLNQAGDKPIYCSSPVDFNALWKFFFQGGFVSLPQYSSCPEKKLDFKKNYEKLFTRHPEIARQFLFKKDDSIEGHMSMLRFFENAWLINHHMAKGGEGDRGGVSILYQMAGFINDFLNLSSSRMNYLLCRYSADEKLPTEVFGGVARQLNNQEKCSLDNFGCLYCRRKEGAAGPANPDWELVPCKEQDIVNLNFMYEQESGGLLLRAMEPLGSSASPNSVEEEFRKGGFRKERHLFALKKGGGLLAVLLLDLSEMALNPFDFTRCLHIFVVNQAALDKKTLSEAISTVMGRFDQTEIPALFFPLSYADSASIKIQKACTLWIMNLRYAEEYFGYMKRLCQGALPQEP